MATADIVRIYYWDGDTGGNYGGMQNWDSSRSYYVAHSSSWIVLEIKFTGQQNETINSFTLETGNFALTGGTQGQCKLQGEVFTTLKTTDGSYGYYKNIELANSILKNKTQESTASNTAIRIFEFTLKEPITATSTLFVKINRTINGLYAYTPNSKVITINASQSSPVGAIHIYLDKLETAIPYIYDGEKLQQVIPYTYDGTNLQICS